MAVRTRIENDPARPDAFPPAPEAEPASTLARERREAAQGVAP